MQTVTEALDVLSFLVEAKKTKKTKATGEAKVLKKLSRTAMTKKFGGRTPSSGKKAKVGGSARRSGGGAGIGQRLKMQLRAPLVQDALEKYLREQGRKPDFASLSLNQLRSVAGNLTWEEINKRLGSYQTTGTIQDKIDAQIVEAVKVLDMIDTSASPSAIRSIVSRKLKDELKAARLTQPDANEIKQRAFELVLRGYLTVPGLDDAGVKKLMGVPGTSPTFKGTRKEFSSTGRDYSRKTGDELVTAELAGKFVDDDSKGGLDLPKAAEFMSAAILVYLDELPLRRKDYRELKHELDSLEGWVSATSFGANLKAATRQRTAQIKGEKTLRSKVKAAKTLYDKKKRAAPSRPKSEVGFKKKQAADEARANLTVLKGEHDKIKVGLVATRKYITEMETAGKRLPEVQKELEALGNSYLDGVIDEVNQAGDNLQNLVGKLEKVKTGRTRDYTIEKLKDDALTFWQSWNDFMKVVSPSGAKFAGAKVTGGSTRSAPPFPGL